MQQLAMARGQKMESRAMQKKLKKRPDNNCDPSEMIDVVHAKYYLALQPDVDGNLLAIKHHDLHDAALRILRKRGECKLYWSLVSAEDRAHALVKRYKRSDKFAWYAEPYMQLRRILPKDVVRLEIFIKFLIG